MLLWIGLAILTAGVLAVLLRPLGTNDRAGPNASATDMSVFHDQLKEIETDRERGLIAGPDADAARAEVARRILARALPADRRQTHETAAAAARHASITPIRNAIAVIIPLFSVAIYLLAGSPGMPSKPYAPPGLKPVEQASQEELVAMVEARLRAEPGDGKGWDVIAPVYFSLGRFADSQDAYANAIRILGESPARLKGVAEAAIIANNGLVTEEARKAFERLLVLDPNNGEAQFGLALGLEQDGKLAEAAQTYRKLLSTAPADAPWRPSLEVRLARLVRGGAPPQVGLAPPEGTSKEEQEKFILGMVERLAARLKTNGKDLGGWQQLVRSYKVLGRDQDAVNALAEARRNFEGDQKSLSTLAEFAATLGIGS